MTKLNQTQPVTAGKVPASKPTQNPAIKRRSSRVAIDMPVVLFGQQVNGKVFTVDTRTTVVNAHGALLTVELGAEIKPSLLLINRTTKAEVQCRVVFQKEMEKGKVELGVEFLEPQPRFWGIAFPPEDWNNADRKKPESQSK